MSNSVELNSGLSYEQLMVNNLELSSQVKNLEHEIRLLHLALINARHNLFGKKSEVRKSDGQQLLLGEALQAPGNDAEGQGNAGREVTIAEHTRRKKVKQQDENEDLSYPDSLPREETTLFPSSTVCDCCGELMNVIEEVRTEKLAAKRTQFYVAVTIRPVYGCRQPKCGKGIKQEPVPAGTLKGSKLDLSFLVWILVEKYLYAMPLYRIHQKLEAAGVKLSRSTLLNLVHLAGNLLRPVAMAQWESVLSSRALHVDETPQQVGVGKGKKKKHQRGWLWPVVGDRREVVFHFDLRRGSAVLKKILGDYQGFIHADGHSAYQAYCKQGAAYLVSCWDHARREFIKAERESPTLATAALRHIRKLYEVEDEIKEQGLGDEEIVDYRQRHARPVMEKFKEWLEHQSAVNSLLPKDKLSLAINYCRRRWESLTMYLLFGNLSISNIEAEQRIRSTVVGRKNWLFHGSEDGAMHSATIYSILLTCGLQGVNAQDYLQDVLQVLLSETQDALPEKRRDYSPLTPRCWQETRTKSAEIDSTEEKRCN